VVAEIYAGLSAFKAMFDMAKGLKDINDAAIRNGAVIELQEQILSAQGQQSALIERIQALETEVASFERWDSEKERYELSQLGQHGIFAYSLKETERATEPAHWICPDCYQRRVKSILQQVSRVPGRADVRLCQTCGWEAYVTGVWQSDHEVRRSANSRTRR
jgi:hypothetical protein